jgi:hypothetical protein
MKYEWKVKENFKERILKTELVKDGLHCTVQPVGEIMKL